MKRRSPRGHKYGAKKTVLDGITFASATEARRYAELKVMEAGKLICNLKLQPSYVFYVEGVKICKYIADFSYNEPNGLRVVEDVKGYPTPVFKLKAKLFRALYPDYDFRIIQNK